MRKRWREMVVLVVLAVGVILGAADGKERGLAVVKTQQELHKELFKAVEQKLTNDHVPVQDMPKRILSVQSTGVDRYRVHMEMVQGTAWFEVWRTGAKWEVRGLNLPPSGAGLRWRA